eukprot:TRINITY_DN1950_c0_g1_i1.p1 TRINITY_DN1950_c0_g1~~TRINITY_DN1950_c0_g1_i1.p1  ORF type:complete len:451 (-),score=89.79 TRINITY_DN1950_c0_g1_i1:47-1399(-)
MQNLLIPDYQSLHTMWSKNRASLSEVITAMGSEEEADFENVAVYMEGNVQKMRNNDTDLLFRQDSNFLYLTGADIPGSAFWMDQEGSILFVPKLSEKDYTWHGAPVSNEALQDKYGITIKYITDFETFFESKKEHIDLLLVNRDPRLIDPELFNETAVDMDETLNEILRVIRSVKNDEEVELIRQVCSLSSEGHTELMKMSKPGLNELHFDSFFRYYTASRGCKHQAYIPIVGAGPYSAILHYNDNDKFVKDGDLVLIDAGAEFLGYASDITRTFPANGKFTQEQKEVYTMVLNVQKQVISELAVGKTWVEMSERAEVLLIEELLKNNFVTGDVNTLRELKILRRLFMPHGLGHHIGLDVHDSTIFPDVLVENMVVTVEPGIYFNPVLVDSTTTDEELIPHLNVEKIIAYRDFGGVRIEDDILITSSGPISLTSTPKEIEEIESVMSRSN